MYRSEPAGVASGASMMLIRKEYGSTCRADNSNQRYNQSGAKRPHRETINTSLMIVVVVVVIMIMMMVATQNDVFRASKAHPPINSNRVCRRHALAQRITRQSCESKTVNC
jgi:hypothetical protein